MYREYRPSELLSKYINAYWTVSGYYAEVDFSHILPDGCVDIILSLSNNTHQPLVVGTITSYIEVPLVGKVNMLGVRFNPCGVKAFTRIPINELTDQNALLSDIESIFDEAFYGSIGLMDVSTAVTHIDSYLLKQLPHLYSIDERVHNAVELINKSNGLLSASSLLSKVCLSERQLQRRFKAEVGVSPKFYSRIVRFNHVRRFLKAKPNQSLFDTAADFGYHDHAHFIRDFQQLSGYSPAKL